VLPKPRQAEAGLCVRAAEQGDEADEAFGGTVTRQKCRLMPAPSPSDAGTASQLIPGVRRLLVVR